MNEVLGLTFLNYGLWDNDPLTLAGLMEAQERYSKALVDWVPEGVETILDVGCGTGGNALRLHQAGYTVEGLSPDPYQQKVFSERTKLPFHLARLQEFEPPRAYDLTLMSESAQYIWLHAFFDCVRQVTPEGYLLICDYFVTDLDAGEQSKSGHPLEAFLAAAEKEGWILERDEDITDRVLPTLELARNWLEKYVRPTLGIVDDSLQQRNPLLRKGLRGLLGKQLAKAEGQIELLDPDKFKAAKRYVRLLYRLPPTETPAPT